MSDANIKRSTLGGLFWKLMENFGTQLINFIIQVFLARLLAPNEYGIVALIAVFIVIANVFIQTGFSSALIQRKNVSSVEYSSVFFASVILSVVIYIVLYISAGYISAFYELPILKDILRVQAIGIVFAGCSSVHNSILVRELKFKKSFKYRLLGIIIQGLVGISLALLGYGVWALVFSYLSNAIVVSVALWIIVEWRPQLQFSFSKLKDLFSFSSKILAMSLINTIFNNIKSLIIGKSFSSVMLGYYNRGYQIPTLIMTNTDGAINTVMFPVLSKYQDEQEKLIAVYKRTITVSTYIVFPLMTGLIAISEPLTLVLLTEKWLPSVPFMKITCLICMTWPFSIMYQVFNAKGHSNISLNLNIITKVIDGILIILSIRYGVFALVAVSLISSIISIILAGIKLNNVFGYNLMSQFKDIFPQLIASIIMMFILNFVGRYIQIAYLKLLIQILLGACIYMLISMILNIEPFYYLYRNGKEIIKGSRK